MFGGSGEADCPAAQFFAECAQVGGGVELGDEEVGGVPIQVLQTSFASSAQKLDQINDPVSWARCDGLLECIFQRLKIENDLPIHHCNVELAKVGAQTSLQ